MSTSLRAALADPRLALLAGSRLGAITDPRPDDILLLRAQVGGPTMPDLNRLRVSWNVGGARADVVHDLFAAGAGARGIDPRAASALWDALEASWSR